MDELSEQDLVSFNDMTRRKLTENNHVMMQLQSNSREQALLGDFPKALINAVLDSDNSRDNIKMQLLSSPEKQAAYAGVMYDLIMSSLGSSNTGEPQQPEN